MTDQREHQRRGVPFIFILCDERKIINHFVVTAIESLRIYSRSVIPKAAANLSAMIETCGRDGIRIDRIMVFDTTSRAQHHGTTVAQSDNCERLFVINPIDSLRHDAQMSDDISSRIVLHELHSRPEL
jgi:hypothetical protein